MIKLLLICVLIILIIIFTRYTLLYIPKNNSIEFLSAIKGQKYLLNDDYFSKFNKNDIISRNLKESKSEIKIFYSQNILSFNNKDKNSINWIINLLKSKLGNIIFIKKWGFIKVTNKIENGYPHTRNLYIVLSESILNNINDLYNNNSIYMALKNIGSLFIHENVHVYQKMYPKIFENLYTQYWNFTKVNFIENSNKYINNNRTNPDGLDVNWIFNNEIWILSLYNDDKKMNNVRYVGIYLDRLNNGLYSVPKYPKMIDILNISNFKNFFNIEHNLYHPNEICAEIFSIFYLFKMGLSKFNLEIEAFKKFSLWYYNHKSYFE